MTNIRTVRRQVDGTFRVVEYNFKATRIGPSYWVLILAGLLEPLLYLLTVGVGVGSLMDHGFTYMNRSFSYTQFVAPAMLAITAMSATLSVSIFGFHGKLRYARVFEVMLATPIRTFQIALGELIWSLARSGLSCFFFLWVMALLDLVPPVRALAAFPVVLLISAAFSALGMAVTTFVRGWQDFDIVTMVQTGMILFSGTFFPISIYPWPVQVLVQLTPLPHSIQLLRAVCLDEMTSMVPLHVCYLLLALVIGLLVTHRRMDAKLRR